MEHLSLQELCCWNLEGDSFTGDPEGYVKEGSGDASPCGAPLGNLEGGSFTRDLMCRRMYWQLASLSTGAPLGNVGGGPIYR